MPRMRCSAGRTPRGGRVFSELELRVGSGQPLYLRLERGQAGRDVLELERDAFEVADRLWILSVAGLSRNPLPDHSNPLRQR